MILILSHHCRLFYNFNKKNSKITLESHHFVCLFLLELHDIESSKTLIRSVKSKNQTNSVKKEKNMCFALMVSCHSASENKTLRTGRKRLRDFALCTKFLCSQGELSRGVKQITVSSFQKGRNVRKKSIGRILLEGVSFYQREFCVTQYFIFETENESSQI